MSDKTSYLGWKVDYSRPLGEPALQHPSSVQWRVFKNPIALGIGGVAAVLMEFADARIRSGVWNHSTYKQDPIGRSMRTGIAAMVGCYGPASAARRVIQGVTNMHARVNGATPKGEAYRALDPELLDWVAATAGYGFLTAYDRFVAPLSDAEKARFFREGAEVGRLYGAQICPQSAQDFLAMMDQRAARFEPHRRRIPHDHPIRQSCTEGAEVSASRPGARRRVDPAAAHPRQAPARQGLRSDDGRLARLPRRRRALRPPRRREIAGLPIERSPRSAVRLPVQGPRRTIALAGEGGLCGSWRCLINRCRRHPGRA